MGAGPCCVELTDVFCSALLAVSEFKNAVCVYIYILLSPTPCPSGKYLFAGIACVY